MPPRGYKTFTLSDVAYDGVQRVRTEIQQRGVGVLPLDLTDPPRCPACRGAVERVHIKSRHLRFIRCRDCGYEQQVLRGGVSVPVGAIVGAALAALFARMNEKERAASNHVARSSKLTRAPKMSKSRNGG
jgi:hypothetical protein